MSLKCQYNVNPADSLGAADFDACRSGVALLLRPHVEHALGLAERTLDRAGIDDRTRTVTPITALT